MDTGLTTDEITRLVHLVEELAEVQQCVCKILRFGYESCHPMRPGFTNRTDLTYEVGDAILAIEKVVSHDLDRFVLGQYIENKDETFREFTRHQA